MDEKTFGLLCDERREQVLDWWLKVRPKANTPNWDIASTCEIEGRAGLLLVEAEAHHNELSCAGKPGPTTENGRDNHKKIGEAIEDANTELNKILSGWALSRDCHYQLSNRFAWAWKLASLGVPVTLVYLGFLNADEMREPFADADDWTRAVRTYGPDMVPETAWDDRLDVGGTPLWAMIQSRQADPQG